MNVPSPGWAKPHQILEHPGPRGRLVPVRRSRHCRLAQAWTRARSRGSLNGVRTALLPLIHATRAPTPRNGPFAGIPHGVTFELRGRVRRVGVLPTQATCSCSLLSSTVSSSVSRRGFSTFFGARCLGARGLFDFVSVPSNVIPNIFLTISQGRACQVSSAVMLNRTRQYRGLEDHLGPRVLLSGKLSPVGVWLHLLLVLASPL